MSFDKSGFSGRRRSPSLLVWTSDLQRAVALNMPLHADDIRMVRTQSEAKRFFVDKVVAQARLERVSLSDAEHQMLSWSESDPDLVIDPRVPEQLASEMSDDEYERKVVGLLARSFAADVAVSSTAEGQWKQAAEVLHEGDHYILVMVDEAVGGRLKRWWQFWR